jgi:cob(I)alamin adenosyltransferase
MFMRITTKTGDNGYSSVAGKRLKKDNKIFEAIGTIDELQAVILTASSTKQKTISKIAEDLYEIMGNIACETSNLKLVTRINSLEEEINKLEKELKPLTKFLIFKKEKARKLNWVRTVIRRAERRVVILKNKNILVYLNRLSDYYYLLSRIEEEKYKLRVNRV